MAAEVGRCDAMESSSSHNSILQRAEDMIASILQDPFMRDLADDCSVDNVRSQLALLEGRAITVHVHKLDGKVVCEWSQACNIPSSLLCILFHPHSCASIPSSLLVWCARPLLPPSHVHSILPPVQL